MPSGLSKRDLLRSELPQSRTNGYVKPLPEEQASMSLPTDKIQKVSVGDAAGPVASTVLDEQSSA
jgi:hypothetical protein